MSCVRAGLLAALTSLAGLARPRGADAATEWTLEADRLAWHPITVLQGSELPGIGPDPLWRPLIETPSHPETPSGHVAGRFTGATALSRLFHVEGRIDYVAQSALPADANTAAVGMGQYAPVGRLHAMSRQFPSLAAAAQECADSRIWPSAHVRNANKESHRLAYAIVAKTPATLPSLP